MNKQDKYMAILLGIVIMAILFAVIEGMNIMKALLIIIWILAMLLIIVGTMYIIIEIIKEMLNGKRN